MLKLIISQEILSYEHSCVWALFHANFSTYELITLNHHLHDVTTFLDAIIHLLLWREMFWISIATTFMIELVHGHKVRPFLVCIF
jgi:hypothetical protein